MLTTRRQPMGIWQEMNRWQEEMDRLFDRWGVPVPRRFAQAVYPPLNLWEDDNCLYVEAELPGMELEDLEIFVNGENQLTIKGERKQPELEEGTWHRQERAYGSFQRTVELPQPVEPDKVTAEFKLGILTITLPKKEEVRPHRIEVKAG